MKLLCDNSFSRLRADPPHADVDGDGLPLFGVGEHTDYGYLTLLLQDNSGGLQVKLADGSWIDAPPIPGSLVVNLGDALEHNTGCLIKATPHRVRHTSESNRMSFPFFFDPSFPRRMESIVSQLPEGTSSFLKPHVHVWCHARGLITLFQNFNAEPRETGLVDETGDYPSHLAFDELIIRTVDGMAVNLSCLKGSMEFT